MVFNKDELFFLCEKINMPQEAAQAAYDAVSAIDLTPYWENIHKLCDINTAKGGYEKISVLLAERADKGWLWLGFYLIASLETKKKYDQMGIDQAIFYDTIGALSRCVREHMESFGCYGYDRAFWNYRQIEMSLFRIGALEYEMYVFDGEDAVLNGQTVMKKGDNIISIHIPSDAAITPQNCKSSFASAKAFFEEYYPQFNYSVFYCGSWIISPNLKQVLSETSNILAFLNSFEIYHINHDGEGYKSWVFKNKDLTIDQLPQKTSLQRNITAHLKQGGKIGEGYGIIRKENV